MIYLKHLSVKARAKDYQNCKTVFILTIISVDINKYQGDCHKYQHEEEWA